jgi:hypothetical protein
MSSSIQIWLRHQTLDARDGRSFHHEEGEAHLDVPRIGLEPLGHLHEHGAEGIDRDLALVLMQDFHEARHVRAFEVVGQVHVHVESRNGVLLAGGAVLDAHRMGDVLDADAVDGDTAGIHPALDVLDGDDGSVVRGGHKFLGVYSVQKHCMGGSVRVQLANGSYLMSQ